MTEPTKTVLYVSDSLGTPIHPRGIFNYSVSAVEILKALGFAVTLVVEGSPGFGVGIGSASRRIGTLPGRALDVMRLAEIYRYFDESHFGFAFEYPSRFPRFLATHATRLLARAHRAQAAVGRLKDETVANDVSQLDWVPPAAAHLRLADRLRTRDGFYSQSMLRAVNGTGPVSLDASGYDLVFVDTPHYAELTGIPRDRVLAVVHDLIPLQDNHMAGDWRRLFARKLEATLAMAGTLIFVSETTRDIFRTLYPQHAAMPDLILYPAIRADLLAKAADLAPPRTDYVCEIGPNRRARTLAARSAAVPESLPVALALGQVDMSAVLAFLDPGSEWNPALPFFATVVSDEPRKNIKIFVAAAAALRDRANLVVIGQVDPDRHTGGAPEKYPNLHFTGYVTDGEKLDLIRGSAGLIFASFSEGFGIPVVEGAIFGRPVICSDIPVFREITGGLATYIDPNEPDDLVRAVDALLADRAGAEGRAEPLRASCRERYNQDAMAVRLHDVLARIAARPALGRAA